MEHHRKETHHFEPLFLNPSLLASMQRLKYSILCYRFRRFDPASKDDYNHPPKIDIRHFHLLDDQLHRMQRVGRLYLHGFLSRYSISLQQQTKRQPKHYCRAMNS